MISFPHCKINLGLNVISKRSDGYHNIETCFYPVPRVDILEIIPTNEFSFSQSGVIVPGDENDNLCVKAFHLLKNDFRIKNVKIHLHKLISVGAGLGGGSSDGSFTLRLLDKIFDLKIPVEQLKIYASQLGSDCSFFVEDHPMIGTRRGENLSSASVSLKGCYLVLVNPGIHIPTSNAYSGIVSQQPEFSIEETLKFPVTEWAGKLKNDFEESIFAKHPIIGQLKEKLYSSQAVYASMSGSGSSVYGIFEKPVDLKNDFAGMDYWSGELK